MTPAEIMGRFCSLGGNCEFGIAQRAYGAEPMDLFRWAATPPVVLIDLLNNDFDGLDEIEVLPASPGGEYTIRNTRYNFMWHSFTFAPDPTAAEVLARERRRLPRLADFMRETLIAGERILVRLPEHRTHVVAVGQMLAAIRRYGNCPLLHAVLADDNNTFPTIKSEENGLLWGYIDQFAGLDVAATTKAESWLTLCTEALRHQSTC